MMKKETSIDGKIYQDIVVILAPTLSNDARRDVHYEYDVYMMVMYAEG